MMSMDQGDDFRKTLDITKSPPNTPLKKSPNSTIIGKHSVSIVWGWLAGFPMLDNLSPQTKKYIINQILNKVKEKGYSLNAIDVLEYTDYANIIRPFGRLNEFLRNTTRREQAYELLKAMLFAPFTIPSLTETYDYLKYSERRSLIEFARRLANVVVQCGILTKKVAKSGENGIRKNKRLWGTAYYYIEGLHTDEEIEVYVFKEKRFHAELIGWDSDREEKNIVKIVENSELKSESIIGKGSPDIDMVDLLKKQLQTPRLDEWTRKKLEEKLKVYEGANHG